MLGYLTCERVAPVPRTRYEGEALAELLVEGGHVGLNDREVHAAAQADYGQA